MKKIFFKSQFVMISIVLLGMLGLGKISPAQELVKAAKKEGELRIVAYPSLTPLAKAFEKKYGINVEGVFVGSPGILRKVSQESDAGIFGIDVFTSSPGPVGNALNKWTLPYRPVGIEKVAKVTEVLPADWNQVPLFKHVVGLIYNKEMLSGDQVPKSIYDLLKPEFKGKIISRTPWLGSNLTVHILSYFTWFHKDMKKWHDYFSRLKVNIGRYEPKFPALHFPVGLKEFPVGIFTLPYTATLWGDTYPGLAYSTFREGGIWWPNMAAIHKKAPHPNAAKLFVTYLISEEGQRLFAEGGLIPARDDVPPKEELKEALKGIKLFDGQLQQIYAREISEHQKEWQNRIKELYK